MPQVFTHLLNKTVTAILANSGTPNFDSLSVRIRGLCRGGYAELFGITWNLSAQDGSALNDAIYTRLMIIKNEVFDPVFDYNNPQVDQQKDVIFRDTIIPQRGNPAINARIAPYARHLNFKPAMKLNGAADYLVIITAPVRVAGGANYRLNLTVRGSLYAVDTSKTLAAGLR